MSTDKKTYTVYRLVRRLRSGDYHVRDQAEEAFKDLGDPKNVEIAVKEISPLLEDEEDAFSSSAARALASCGLPAVEPLITVLKTGTKLGRMHALALAPRSDEHRCSSGAMGSRVGEVCRYPVSLGTCTNTKRWER